ncbi:MAG: PQQ-binding-like beta-propeller repeat protein, partial [Tepidisphaeraceae bacterium]
MRTTVNAILGSVLLLSSVLQAADSPPFDSRARIVSDLKSLTAIRDALAAKLDKRMASNAGSQAVRDLTLRLDEGADRDQLDLVLPRRSGAWMSPYAVVPYWRQGTAKDRMKLLQQRAFSVPFDRFRYPINAALLAITDQSVSGSVEVTLALDQLWDERFPPNSPICLPNTRELFSWYDIPREVGHRRLRKQNFTIDADIRKDVHEFVLYFNDAYNKGPLHMTFQVPGGGWCRPDVRTPGFNLGWHQADVSGLTFKDGRLTGTAKLTIAPDGFMPKNLEPRLVSLTIDGRADGGRFAGRYRIVGKLGASDDEGEATGEVTGAVGAVVSGFYSATGELGVCHGAVSGTIHEPPATCRGMLAPATGELPSDGTVAAREATARAVRLYQEIGALQLAFTQYPCPLVEALADVGALTVEMDAGEDAPVVASLDLAAGYVARLRSTAEDTAKRTETPFVAPATVADPDFGPFFGAEPLPTSADRRVVLPAIGDATGTQRWQFIPEWTVLGPFFQRQGLDHNVAQLPDVVPASEGNWRQTSSPRVGRSTGETFRWTPRSATNGKLSWTGEPWSLGWAGRVWYAATEVMADADREVWISIAAVGPAKLWLNDRLVWAAEEPEFAFRDRQEEIVKLPLRKGSNRFLARCRNDEEVCWLRVHICTAGSPRTAAKPVAAVERVPSAPREPEPPLAWDLEKNINVRWKTPLGRGSGAAIDGKRLFVSDDPHTLHCLNADTGKEIWSAEVNILEFFGNEAMDEWKKAGSPEARYGVFAKYKLADGRATTITDKAGTAPVTDGRCVWVHMSTGVAACFHVDGQRLWIVRTPFVSAKLALADDVAIVAGAVRDVKSGGGPYLLLALDRKTGEIRWKQSARGALLGLVRPTGASAPVIVAGWGQIFDASTGRVLNDGTGIDLLHAGGTSPASYGVSLTPDGIFFATRLRVAYRWWGDSSGRVGLRFLGENVSEWGSNGNDPLQPLADGGLLYTWGIVQEAGRHCPSPKMELNVFDAANGRFVSRVKPVMTDATSGIPPVRIGDYLYLGDTGSGSFTTQRTGQYAVLRAGPKPYIVCRNYFPPRTNPRPV